MKNFFILWVIVPILSLFTFLLTLFWFWPKGLLMLALVYFDVPPSFFFKGLLLLIDVLGLFPTFLASAVESTPLPRRPDIDCHWSITASRPLGRVRTHMFVN